MLRLLEELRAEAEEKSYEAHMARRAEIEQATGRPVRGRRPNPQSTTHRSRRQANTTDPDSRLLKTKDGYIQGYNAQAVTTEDQFIVAAEVTNNANDAPSFQPLIAAAKKNLRGAGERRRIRRVAADAGYWSEDNANLAGVETFIAPGRSRDLDRIAEQDKQRSELLARIEAGELAKEEAAAALGVTRTRVNQLLRSPSPRRPGAADDGDDGQARHARGKRIYKKRAASIEPIFGQIKHNRRIDSFPRRGMTAADSEWKLITATHNMLKLWRFGLVAG